MSNKPTPDPEVTRELGNFYRENPEDAFIAELYWRARGLVDGSGLPKSAITLEMMESAFSAFEGGLEHEDISSGYPVKAWREDTVEIPRAWLRMLVDGWRNYKAAPSGCTFGEAFGVEGGKQGAKKARETLSHYNQGLRLSNATVVEYLAERQSGGNGSWERAYGLTEDYFEGPGAGTIKRASEKHRHRTLSTSSYLGIIAGCTTSRSGAPDPDE